MQVAREEATQKRQEEKETAFKAEKKKKKKSDQEMAEVRSKIVYLSVFRLAKKF